MGVQLALVAIAGPAGTSAGRLRFQTPGGDRTAIDDARHGAGARRRELAAAWAPTARGRRLLAAGGVTISPLRPANCGFTVDMVRRLPRSVSKASRSRAVALDIRCGHTLRGEAIITRAGIEGGR